MDSFNNLNATVFGISVDSPWANGAFSKEYSLNFELLSDYNRDVIKQYDVTFEGLGGLEGYESSNRAVIIIDSCLLYTSPSPRDKRQSRMPSSA